jgi:hypothetical protein
MTECGRAQAATVLEEDSFPCVVVTVGPHSYL